MFKDFANREEVGAVIPNLKEVAVNWIERETCIPMPQLIIPLILLGNKFFDIDWKIKLYFFLISI